MSSSSTTYLISPGPQRLTDLNPAIQQGHQGLPAPVLEGQRAWPKLRLSCKTVFCVGLCPAVSVFCPALMLSLSLHSPRYLICMPTSTYEKQSSRLALPLVQQQCQQHLSLWFLENHFVLTLCLSHTSHAA